MSTKAPSGITIMINEVPTDLAEVSWYEKAPCGCVCGASIAYSDYGSGPARIIVSAEQVADKWWDTKREREKYEGLGFTFYPDLTSKVTELLSLQNECPHTPTYGIPPRLQAEGYEWAAVDAMGTRSPLMHLVPTIAVENAREHRYGSDRGRPICGGKAAFWWKTDQHVLSGKVECSRCMKKAAAAEAVPA